MTRWKVNERLVRKTCSGVGGGVVDFKGRKYLSMASDTQGWQSNL